MSCVPVKRALKLEQIGEGSCLDFFAVPLRRAAIPAKAEARGLPVATLRAVPAPPTANVCGRLLPIPSAEATKVSRKVCEFFLAVGDCTTCLILVERTQNTGELSHTAEVPTVLLAVVRAERQHLVERQCRQVDTDRLNVERDHLRLAGHMWQTQHRQEVPDAITMRRDWQQFERSFAVESQAQVGIAAPGSWCGQPDEAGQRRRLRSAEPIGGGSARQSRGWIAPCQRSIRDGCAKSSW